MLISQRGGLFLAEQAAVPDSIRRELKRLDPDLVLAQQPDERHGRHVWKVMKRVGWDRPAVWIMDWRDDQGRPLELTSRLVDEVASRRLGSRREFLDPLAENDAREEKERAERLEAYADAARAGYRRARTSPMLQRGVGLRMARDKARARGEAA